VKVYYILDLPDEDLEDLEAVCRRHGWRPPVCLRGALGRRPVVVDRQKLMAAFGQCNGRVGGVAAALNLSHGTARRRLRECGLLPAASRKPRRIPRKLRAGQP